jgi:formiminotetrahydrofolate cyclodeaminase
MIEEQTLADYLRALASKAATPGGGAAAGTSGAQACALIAMVCRLTRGNEQRVSQILALAEHTRVRFLQLSDEDMQKFESVMAAYKMPPAERNTGLQAALKAAAEVPLEMIDEAIGLIDSIAELAEIGNANLVTDTGIASLLVEATIRSARLNVLVNLKSIDDASFVRSTQHRLSAALDLMPKLASISAAIDDALTATSKESSP